MADAGHNTLGDSKTIDNTTCGEDGYPLYQRRDNGRTHQSGTSTATPFVFDNRWVVPYNPYLTGKYDCHINVEIASTIGAVKYLFKYVYKGQDRAAFAVHDRTEPIDEISDYLDGRYISPVEACYRIFEYELNKSLSCSHPLGHSW